jgi:hypothetical protein
MWYKVTFFNLKVGQEDWQKLFSNLIEADWSIKVTILKVGQKIEFYLGSEKKLDVLNSKLFPFFLSGDLSEKEINAIERKGGKKVMPTIISKPLLSFCEDNTLNNQNVEKISFWVKRFSPVKTLPKLNLWINDLNSQKEKNKWAFLLVHLYQFLSFDLTNSIMAEVSKVKPKLVSESHSLNTYSEGILEAADGKKFSVGSYDFGRHTLIMGQSGSGKSVLAKLIIEDIAKNYINDYGVVLVDPHGALDQTIKFEGQRKTINFKDNKTNLFVNVGQPMLSTELTIDLFSTVLNINENQDLMRVLKFSLHTLFGINKMTLMNLRNLLTDSLFRKELMKEVTDENNLAFFETEFQGIFNAKYSTTVLPILNLVSELDFMQSTEASVDLTEEVNKNFLTSISIKQSELGKNVTRIIGGAIIQQIYTMLMAGLVKKKILLVIDEVSVVQTPSLIHILSEARKFGLVVVVIQQYMMQVSAEILKSIFANMVNYFCFKLARDDAEVVVRNLNMEIDEYFLKNENDPREVQELGTKILTDLNPQEVICRVMANNEYVSPFKSKTVKVNM